MNYQKTIVCLANSRKRQGRCVAGKEVLERGYGLWIRPVGAGNSGELHDERLYADGIEPRLGDLIRVALDVVPSLLWHDGDHSSGGRNDRIPEAEVFVCALESSLMLIEACNVKLMVCLEGLEYGRPRKRVRAQFRHGQRLYVLAVTDPRVEARLMTFDAGHEEIIAVARLCLSISEPYQGYCYKLVAGVIVP